MNETLLAPVVPELEYPSSDGERMAENTQQFDWISLVKWGLEAQFRHDPLVFVAGDNLIYPVKGRLDIRVAPDVYCAFGRPKGHRGSWKVHEEEGIFPQVVFEVWSPGNRQRKMAEKFAFYEKYGAEEYYIIYPGASSSAEGWIRKSGKLEEIETLDGWISPRLGIRFDLSYDLLAIIGRDGRPFERPDELAEERAIEEERRKIAEAERSEARMAQRAAEVDAEKLRRETEDLKALLRSRGIEPPVAP